MMLFLGWNVTASQAIDPLPYIVQAQRLFAQQISFGDVMQSAAAFGAIHDALSFFRNAYNSFASYRAALIRLDGLIDANTRASKNPPAGDPGRSSGRRVSGSKDVEVRTPDGASARQGSRHAARTSRHLRSPSRGARAAGKTILLESLAGMWPYASGGVRLPAGMPWTRCSSPAAVPAARKPPSLCRIPTRRAPSATGTIQQALRGGAAPPHHSDQRTATGERSFRSANSSGSPSPASC